MKRITLYLKEGMPIIFDDIDEQPRENYINKLLELLSNNNITILHTHNDSLAVRPSTVSGIRVMEILDTSKTKSPKKIVKKPKSIAKSGHKDIISD